MPNMDKRRNAKQRVRWKGKTCTQGNVARVDRIFDLNKQHSRPATPVLQFKLQDGTVVRQKLAKDYIEAIEKDIVRIDEQTGKQITEKYYDWQSDISISNTHLIIRVRNTSKCRYKLQRFFDQNNLRFSLCDSSDNIHVSHDDVKRYGNQLLRRELRYVNDCPDGGHKAGDIVMDGKSPVTIKCYGVIPSQPLHWKDADNMEDRDIASPGSLSYCVINGLNSERDGQNKQEELVLSANFEDVYCGEHGGHEVCVRLPRTPGEKRVKYAYAKDLYIKVWPKNPEMDLQRDKRKLYKLRDALMSNRWVDELITFNEALPGSGTPEHVVRRAQRKFEKKNAKTVKSCPASGGTGLPISSRISGPNWRN